MAKKGEGMSDRYRLVDRGKFYFLEVLDATTDETVASVYHKDPIKPTPEERAFAEDLVTRMNQPVIDPKKLGEYVGNRIWKKWGYQFTGDCVVAVRNFLYNTKRRKRKI